MNRKLNTSNVVLSILIGVTLILTTVNPTAAYASAPTIKVTPPPTKTPEPTATPVEVTPTPAPTETPISYEPALSLQSDPTYITPGGQVTFLYQISNVEKFTETTILRFHVPFGFAPLNPEEGKYDQENGIFDLPVIASEGKIAWQTDDTLVAPVGIYAELIQDEKTIAEAKLELTAPVEYKIETTGGTAESVDGEVQVNFPAGAVSETVTVKVTEPSYESLPVQSLSGAPFEITAVSDTSKAEVSQFSKAIEIQVRYDDSALADSEDTIMLYWYDPADGEWKLPLSQRVDTENNLIIAYTDHFTVFDTYSSNWDSAETPTLSAFQTSAFTGASSYALPIQVPPGPGGFQPSLTLSYSSMVADSVSSNSQASWVGMGWSLTNSYIEMNKHGTQGTNKGGDDTYELVLNGTSARLYKDSSGKYHTSDETFLKIEYDDVTKIWTIWDKGGTQYIFDHRTPQFVYQQSDCTLHQGTWRWSLSSARSIYDQIADRPGITYTYVTETKPFAYSACDGGPMQYADSPTWVYPETILYANGKYRITFDRLEAGENGKTWRTDLKSIWTAPTSYQAFQRSLLEAIKVEHNNNGSWETIRTYKFTYCQNESCGGVFPKLVWEQGGGTPTLMSVQEFGLGGAYLPATTFTYGDKMHLTSAQNGYGGTVTFQYNNQPNSTAPSYAWKETRGDGAGPMKYEFNTGSTQGWKDTSLDGWGHIIVTPLKIAYNDSVNSYHPGRWYKLKALVKANGASASVSLGFAYKENGAMSGDTFSPATALNGNWKIVESEPFFLPVNATQIVPKIKANSGWVVVDWVYLVPMITVSRVTTQTLSADGTPFSYTYDYHDDPNTYSANTNSPSNLPNGTSDAAAGNHPFDEAYTEFRGHKYVTVTDPYGGKSFTEFCQSDICVGSPLVSETRTSTDVLAQRTTYTYASQQWPAITLYDCESLGCLEAFDPLYIRFVWTNSTTSTIFRADGSTEACSLQTLYDYDTANGNLLSQTVSGSGFSTLTIEYSYLNIDNGDRYIIGLSTLIEVLKGQDVISKVKNEYDTNGILTKTRQLMDTTRYGQVSYGYDAWGNLTSLTTWSGYGQENADPTEGVRTATTSYDSAYNTYPISITTPPTSMAPAGMTTTLTYNYALGVPLTAVGPNGSATAISAEYDPFGRLIKLARPGDDLTSPTLAIQYNDTNQNQLSAFVVTLTQKIDPGLFYTVTRTYNGMGLTTSVTAGGTTTQYQYTYEGNLRVDKVSTPYASGETYYWAKTAYDSLGRPSTVTAPDTTVTNYAYDGLKVTVTDANSNATSTTTDILGRTVFVDAPIGPDIAFGYDDLGNLTSATRGGATTKMKYDLAGRKIGMDDPDMGTRGSLLDDQWGWAYSYDALGNLLTQTDMRGCVTTLQYDSLNRPTDKTYSNCPASVETTPSVHYYYDGQSFMFDSVNYGGSPYSVGQRTGVVVNGSNATAWTYDVRGRLISETTDFAGANNFTTQFTYNRADMLRTMTYPDSEVVTYDYNNKMQLINVAGTETYASSFVYDSANRLQGLTLGSNLGEQFRYKPWNVQGGGRLDVTVYGRGIWTEGTLSYADTLLKNTYSYDSVGNITSIYDSKWEETQTFEYDSLYRLTSASATGGLANYSENYGYNPTTGNLEAKGSLGLQYYDSAHVHAVTNAGSNTYGSDANGNQTTRTIAGQTVTLGYDAENRLVSATGANLSAQFTFDGDGRRVKSVVNGETILFAGGHYELKGNEVTKYYFAGASRIAVRKTIVPQSSTLTYLAGDHLGSASLAVDASTGEVIQTRYKPWGEVRSTTPSKTLPTRYTFTGQYSYVSDDATDLGNAGFGLMFYNARWYDSTTGRFVQADSVVPGGLQGLDRYSYVANNPINFIDPTGHGGISASGSHPRNEDWQKKPKQKPIKPPKECTGTEQEIYDCIRLKYPNITIDWLDEWSPEELMALDRTLNDAFVLLGGSLAAFERAFGKVTFDIVIEIADMYGNLDPNKAGRTTCSEDGCVITVTHASLTDPTLYELYWTDEWVIAHELGHVFDYRLKNKPSKEFGKAFPVGWGPWRDCRGTTQYGCTKGREEDFAETFAVLIAGDPKDVISDRREHYIMSSYIYWYVFNPLGTH